MKVEHHVVLMLTMGIVFAANGWGIGGLLLYFGIAEAILFCCGVLNNNMNQNEVVAQ